MHTKHLFQELLLVVAALCAVQASWVDLSKSNAQHLNKRQVGDLLGGASSSSALGADSTPSPSPSSSPSASSAGAASTSEAAPSTSSSLSQAASTPVSSSTPAAESTSSTSSSSSVAAESTSSTSSSVSSSSTSYTAVVSTSVEVATKTRSDGTKETTTSVTKTTTTPDLNSQDGDGSTSGMSTKTRNTVIGVVVGIGGAIVIGALAVVAWRVWGRKKQHEENDGLMAYDMSSAGVEKSERGSSAGGPASTPFQSTLDNYHQPGHVNASSNF